MTYEGGSDPRMFVQEKVDHEVQVEEENVRTVKVEEMQNTSSDDSTVLEDKVKCIGGESRILNAVTLKKTKAKMGVKSASGRDESLGNIKEVRSFTV